MTPTAAGPPDPPAVGGPGLPAPLLQVYPPEVTEEELAVVVAVLAARAAAPEQDPPEIAAPVWGRPEDRLRGPLPGTGRGPGRWRDPYQPDRPGSRHG
ncbi:MAG: acyl-CoA carboxylase epsilon subunit [Kineosporiaceae bacterium]